MKLEINFLLFIVLLVFEIIQKNYVNSSEIIQKKQQRHSKWSQRVVRKIKKDPKIYQIMLITDTNREHCEIIQNLQENLPILYFNGSYSKRKIQHLQKWNSLKNPRDTTLFLIIESPGKKNTQWIEEVMEFVKKLSTVRIRPKCLIIRFLNSDETSDYGKFLQKMWQNLFLDVTVLDVVKEHHVTIHQLNPFVSYKSKQFSKKTPLFPDKLRNLNGYPINVAIFNRPPFVTLKRNSTNHPVNVSGPDAEMGKIFAKMMNYKQVLVPSVDEYFGQFSCNVDELTGFISSTQKNKIQFIGVTTISPRYLCRNEIVETPIFALDQMIAVTPILMTNNFSIIVIGMTFYYSILLTILMIITSWIIVKAFKFDEKIWNWVMIIKVLFGVGIENEPINLRERIIFSCFLILNFYYSNSFLASLTDFNFRLQEEKEINTLNDLIKSGLRFSSENNVAMAMLAVLNENDVRIWIKNGQTSSQDVCLENLLYSQNVTCIAKLSHMEWFAGFYRKQKIVKYLPEFLSTAGSGLIVEPGSPYVEKFEQMYRKLMEFALLERWQMKKLPNATRHHQLNVASEEKAQQLDENDDDEWKIQSLLIGLLMVGYLISILSFIVELAIGKWKRRQKSQ